MVGYEDRSLKVASNADLSRWYVVDVSASTDIVGRQSLEKISQLSEQPVRMQ